MEPRPVVTIHGNVSLFRNLVEGQLKKLIESKKPNVTGKDGFSPHFGVSFKLFETFMTVPSVRRPFYAEPCLHTFWIDVADTDEYRTRDKSNIVTWVHYIETHRGYHDVEWFVVGIITKEKKSSKKLEKMKADFGNNLLQLKLVQSDSSREHDHWQTLTDRLYSSAFKGFFSLLSMQMNEMATVQSFDTVFCKNVNLAIGYELINQPEIALTRYKKLNSDLGNQLQSFAHRKECPEWCVKLIETACVSWYCPNLSTSNESWKLLQGVQTWNTSLLEVRLFLYTRMTAILFDLSRAWQAEDMCSDILYATAREMRWFKVDCPPCGFECWAYSVARVTVLEIMLHLTADIVQNAYISNSPLLIRVRLWKYALEKLETLGRQCCLMPHDQEVNQELIDELLTGLEGQDPQVEEETQLMKALSSKKGFSEVYVDMGMRVIGAMKHARRRRMAFHVAKTVGMFLCEEGRFEEAEELLLDICKYCPYEGWSEMCGPVYQILAKCQKKLNKMAAYVQTVAKVLALCADCNEDATFWMQELKQSSLLPHESFNPRNVLKWSPLLVLSGRPSFGGSGDYFANSSIEVSLSIVYKGSEVLKVDSVCLTLGATPRTPLSSLGGSRPPTSLETPGYGHRQKSPFANKCESMESLDLLEEDSSPQLIPPDLETGDDDMVNYVLETAMPKDPPPMSHSLSFGSIQNLDETDQGGSVYLLASQVVLSPGENSVILSGVPSFPGTYVISQASISLGNLRFVTPIPNNIHWGSPLIVQGRESNIDISIVPVYSALLIGPKQPCVLKMSIGMGSCVPADAKLTLTSKNGIQFIPLDPEEKDLKDSISLVLPSIGAGESYETVFEVAISCQTAEEMVNDDYNQLSKGVAHQFVATYNWLYPPQSHVLLLPVYKSIGYKVEEYFTADKSFLHLTMKNSCPLPLLVHSQSLTTDLETTPLHEPMPMALLPAQEFSFLYDVETAENGKPVPARFSVKWLAVTRNECTHEIDDGNISEFIFTINSTKADYVVYTTITAGPDGKIWSNRNAQLQFEIKSKCNQKETLDYEVVVNEEYWKILSPLDGKIEMKPTLHMCFQILPLVSGQLPYPVLVLKDQSQSAGAKTKSLYSVKRAECVYVYGLND